MTVDEKKEIYALLRTVASSLYGCSAREYEQEPVFSADVPDGPAAQSAPEYSSPSVHDGAPSSLDAVAAAIASCRKCGLCAKRRSTVPGTGCTSPAVLVIGEGPGADEDASGLPFVGRAGQLLDKMLAAISLSRTANCFIANIVKCRPPNNRDPLPDEMYACRPYLDAQISLLRPASILAVGRIAAQNLLNTSEGIGRLHGVFREYNGIPFMATYHPSALLRNAELKRPAWEDLKLFRSRLETLVPGYAEPFNRERGQPV